MYLVRHTPVWQYLALATLCVPVIIQPLVEQAFHNLLPYRDMALFYSSSDLASLPDLLRAVPPNRVCELRRAAAYYRAVVWEEPEGLAYDVLQLSLCHRAAALHERHHPGMAEPAWAACSRVKVQDLL